MENFDEVLKIAEWNKEASVVWQNIENNNVPTAPDDLEKANHYANHLRYLMDHNQEKYRDKDGIEFYKRLNEYIERLNTTDMTG